MIADRPSLDFLTADFVDAVSGKMRRIAAASVLPRWRNLHDADIETKNNEAENFVTIADTEAEEALTPECQDMLPGSLFVGEEAVSRDPSMLRHLERTQWCWIADPVDGTREFKEGTTKFRMLLALAYRGVPYAGWMLVPNVEDRRAEAQTVICGVRGKGVWIDAFERGARVVVDPADKPEAQIKCVLQRRSSADCFLDSAEALPQFLGGVTSTWCCGATFDTLMRGGDADAVSFDKCHITPWDFAAPYLLVTEAGGVWHLDGGAPFVACKDNSIRFIAARNDRVFRLVQKHAYPDWRG